MCISVQYLSIKCVALVKNHRSLNYTLTNKICQTGEQSSITVVRMLYNKDREHLALRSCSDLKGNIIKTLGKGIFIKVLSVLSLFLSYTHTLIFNLSKERVHQAISLFARWSTPKRRCPTFFAYLIRARLNLSFLIYGTLVLTLPLVVPFAVNYDPSLNLFNAIKQL